MGKTEKIIVVMGITVASVLTLAVVVFNDQIREKLGMNDVDSNEEEETSSEAGESVASLNIYDNGDGTASVYFKVTREVSVAGIDVSLKISDGLIVESVECGRDMNCILAESDGEQITISAIRGVSDAETPLEEQVDLAVIKYDQSSSGTLTANAQGADQIEFFEVGSDDNMADNSEAVFSVGGE